MGLLEGKSVLVTGVLSEASIAFEVARLVQQEGGNAILSSFGRQMRLTRMVAAKLPTPPPLVELDVSKDEDLAALEGALREHTDHLDGVLHSIGFAPARALGGDFLKTKWPDVATALQISTFSYKSLAMAVRPLLGQGSSIVGLTFDSSNISYPVYDWMGVAKAGLESANRYLARYLGADGIRCNLVAAGPIRTTAAKSIRGFDELTQNYEARAPLGWDFKDALPTAKACVALLSDLFPATTGAVIPVDGGFHSTAM